MACCVLSIVGKEIEMKTIIYCAICGEDSGAAGSSMYGFVHKYGPTNHVFTPAERRATYADIAYGSPAEQRKADRDEHNARNR